MGLLGKWAKRSVRRVPEMERPEIPRRWAWALVIGAFLGGFGHGLLLAVRFLHTGHRTTPASWWDAVAIITRNVGLCALLVTVTVLLLHYLGVRKGYFRFGGSETSTGRRWQRELSIGFLVLSATWASFALGSIITNLLGDKSLAFPQDAVGVNPANVTDLVGGALAGVQEEPLFCIVIPLALLAARCPLWLAVTVSAVARWSFHVYYGWGSVALLFWAAVAVLIVLRTGAIWGVAIVHSWWDVTGLATSLDLPLVTVLALCLFFLGVVVLVAAALSQASNAASRGAPKGETRARIFGARFTTSAT